MSKGWDSAMLKKLKALTGKGLSTSEIGKKLGMSKNAVVGKLNRLGWNLKAGGAPSSGNDAAAKKVVAGKAKAPAKSTRPAAVPKKAAAGADKASKKAVSVKTPNASKKGKSAPAPARPTARAGRGPEKNLAMHQRIIQHSLEMANLKPNQCRWPIGDPDSENFHFCGETVFVGKPYCYEHCRQAYQFTPPKKK